MATDANGTDGSRLHQTFPVLSDTEMARIARFGSVQQFARGERDDRQDGAFADAEKQGRAEGRNGDAAQRERVGCRLAGGDGWIWHGKAGFETTRPGGRMNAILLLPDAGPLAAGFAGPSGASSG